MTKKLYFVISSPFDPYFSSASCPQMVSLGIITYHSEHRVVDRLFTFSSDTTRKTRADSVWNGTVTL
jgi:hypothetical protein